MCSGTVRSALSTHLARRTGSSTPSATLDAADFHVMAGLALRAARLAQLRADRGLRRGLRDRSGDAQSWGQIKAWYRGTAP